MVGRAKYGYLLNDSDVRRWYGSVARGSRVTADVYLRRFGSSVSSLRLLRNNWLGWVRATYIVCLFYFWRLYVLRAYFDTQLMIAKSKGLFCTRDCSVQLYIVLDGP